KAKHGLLLDLEFSVGALHRFGASGLDSNQLEACFGEFLGQRRVEFRHTDNKFILLDVLGLDALDERIRGNRLAVVVGAKAIEQSRGWSLGQAENNGIRRKVEQKPAMVARDRAEIAQSFDSLGGAGFVAQTLRRERDTVLVARGVEFSAVRDGIRSFLFRG